MFKSATGSNKNNERDREVSVKSYPNHDLIYLETQPLIDLKNITKKEPEDLTTWIIWNQIQFLSDNKLRSQIFEVELWKRVVNPITLVTMILLAMLFIFGSTRDVTLGRKIFFGVAVGLSFEMLSRIGGAIALSFDFNPMMSAILPSIATMLIAIILLIQKSMS